MDAEIWNRLKPLFESALEQEPAGRAAFVRRACAGEPALEAELQVLLDNYEHAGTFLRSPVPMAAHTRPEVLSPGQLLSGRFRVLNLIGRGGMGEVYAAEDVRLGTRVALKTVPVDASADPGAPLRLMEEIRQARKVTHENVCRVFDLGTHDTPNGPLLFFTMDLLEGETLSRRIQRLGAIPPAEAAAFAGDTARALDAAHRAGIIHRDFKSANVMIVPASGGRQRAVVLDFGLARESAGDDRSSAATGSAVLLGTPAYMAPELLRGAPATPASDVYAWGIVVAEMLTGGKTAAEGALGAAPLRWRNVIRRCLDAEPERRFRSPLDAAEALSRVVSPRGRRWALAAAAAVVLAGAAAGTSFKPSPTSITVFDFENQSKDASLTYFCAGTTSEIVRRLAQIPDVLVMPVHAARSRFQERDHARFSLDGVLQWQDGEARLSVSLVDNRSHGVIWSGAFDRRGLGDPLRTQSEIAAGAVVAVREKAFFGASQPGANRAAAVLGAGWRRLASFGAFRPAGAPTVSNLALDRYMRARDLILQDTPDHIQSGIDLLRSAIQEDPHFALAYAQLARAYITFTGYAYHQTSQILPLAREYAQTAVRLSADLAEAHEALGMAQERAWEWKNVEKAYMEALRLKPGLASARRRYGRLLLLTDRPSEAVTQVRLAAQQDPFDASAPTHLGLTLFMAGQYAEALEVLEPAAQRPDNLNAMHNLADVYAALALSSSEATRQDYLRKALALAGKVEAVEREIHADPRIQTPWADKMHAHFYSLSGDFKRAEPYLLRMLHQMETGTTSPANVAMVLAAQERRGEALDLLERCVALRDPYVPLVKVMPFFSSLRSEPRYRALMNQIGL